MSDDERFDRHEDVDSRAADLMARIEAQRHQREVVQSDWIERSQPVEQRSPSEFDQADPVEEVESANREVDPSLTQPPPAIADEQAPPNEPAVSPAEPSRHRSGRRIAPPPWQPVNSSAGSDFDPRLGGRSRTEEPDVTDWTSETDWKGADGSSVEPEPSEEERQAPVSFGERSPLPPPPPGWNGPPLPSGWPGPPPPGWPGPPPWGRPPAGWRDPRSEPKVRPRARSHAAPTIDYSVPAVPQTLSPPNDLSPVESDRDTPQFGWRRAIHRATGGRVNPGASVKDREQQELIEQIRQPIGSDFRIAVLSIKGGVGKTTTTIGLGSAFAMVRADRVIAVDANPDRGTLSERVLDASTSSTVRDLLRDPHITRYADVRQHTRMAPSRLEVLASEQDPAVAEVFGEADYRRTIEILQNFYNVILTDCGTGIMHSSMASVLEMAHAIVLVSSPAVDAARSAAATLDWLAEHDYGALASEAHVVLSGAQRGSATPQFDKVFRYFEARCGSIHTIPFEPHLAKGADIDFGQLSSPTVRAYLELAGSVAEKFSRVR